MIIDGTRLDRNEKSSLWNSELLQIINKILESEATLTKKICAGRCLLLVVQLLQPIQIETLLLDTQRKSSANDKRVFDSLLILFHIDINCYLSMVEAMVDGILLQERKFFENLARDRNTFKAIAKPLLRALHPVLTGPRLEKTLFEQLMRVGQKMCQSTWPHTGNLLDTQIASSNYTLLNCSHFRQSTIEAVSCRLHESQGTEPMTFECLLHCLLADVRGEDVYSDRAFIAIHWLSFIIDGGICMFVSKQVKLDMGLHAQHTHHPTGDVCEPLGIDVGEKRKSRGFLYSCTALLHHSFDCLHKLGLSLHNTSEHFREQCQSCFERLTRAWQILVHALVQSILQNAQGRKMATQSQLTQGSIFHSTGTQNATVSVLSKEDPAADAACREITTVFWYVWTLIFREGSSTFHTRADEKNTFFVSRELFSRRIGG